MLRHLILIALLPLVTIPFAQASMKLRPAMVRFTAEELKLPSNEKMGLFGSSYLIHLNRYLYSGLGIYSAVTGKRGGFFTGGLESGIKHKLGRDWELDAGLFVGGGGGGSAPQGGGLMIRPHLDLLYKTRFGKIGLQLSQVKFPNGNIDSKQIALSYEKPLSMLQSSQWLSSKQLNSLGSRFLAKNHPATQDFSVLLQTYDLPSGTLNASGNIQDETMSLIGVEWDRYFANNTFFRLQTLGALGGNSDGYASFLMGLGYRMPLLSNNTEVKIGATVGASGGGRVNTKGGLTTDAAVNLQHRFNNGLLLGVRAGYVAAPGGDFKATSYGGYIGYGDRAPDKKIFSSSDVKPRHWRIRATHQTYRPKGDTRRTNGISDNQNIHLIGLQTDVLMNKYSYLTGQAIGAYDGEAGGYAAGLVGAGIILPMWKDSRLELNAEALVGAAGGGGLAVGNGLVGQAMVGIGYRTSRSTSLHLAYGRIKSKEGNFEADAINLSFAYRFTTLAWR